MTGLNDVVRPHLKHLEAILEEIDAIFQLIVGDLGEVLFRHDRQPSVQDVRCDLRVEKRSVQL